MRKQVGKMIGMTCLAAGCIGLLAGCGQSSESVTMDTTALADELQESGIFSSELTKVDDEAASYMVQAAENTQIDLYKNQDGSKTDEILILTGEDSTSTEENKTAADTHLQDVISSFEDYVPEEAAKAEDAVILDKDKYVVLCISNDSDTAKQIIEKYLNGDGSQAKADDSKKKADSQKDDSGDGSESDVKGSDTDTASQNTDYEKIESNDKVTDYGSVVAVGNAAYELYNYSDDAAKNYAGLINKAADGLAGSATVYDLVPPTSTAITFPDNLRDQISSSDQAKSLDKIYGYMDDNVKTVNAYPDLMEHRTEYVYFRTDHHWTALGAYYAYNEFCKTKGIDPTPLENYKTVEYNDFLGSFYKDTNNSSALGNTPDTIKAYYPVSQNVTMDVTDQKGQNYQWDVIHDVTDYGKSLKYSTFIAGDNPMTVITNSDITDGSSCVVVKESFGNALVPFLIDHYQTVYVIDYRYWTGDLVSFVKEKKAQDVLFINNISMTRSNFLIGKLAMVIK